MDPKTSKVVRLLLVEDNEDHAYLIRNAIKRSGSLVIIEHVKDGEEALDYLYRRGRFFLTKRPDLIFLDLNMPKISGHEVLEKIKQDDDLKKIPVVVLTTSDLEKDRNRAMDLKANSYVVKPMDFKAFLEVIQQMCHYWCGVDIGLGRSIDDLI